MTDAPRPRRQRPQPTATQRALGLLTRREHSRRELTRKLAARGVATEIAVFVRRAMRSAAFLPPILTPGASSMRTSRPPLEWPMKCSSRACNAPCLSTWRCNAATRRGIAAVGCVMQRTMRASTPRLRSARPSARSTS